MTLVSLALVGVGGAVLGACLVYRRALAIARHQVDIERHATGWTDGYGVGHALGVSAGRAQVERELALLRLGVAAKHAPLPREDAPGPAIDDQEGDGPRADFEAFQRRAERRMGRSA